MVTLGPTALFSNFKIIKSPCKRIQDFNEAQLVSLKNKLMTNAKDIDDLSIGLDRDRNRRRDELTNYKNLKGKYLVRIVLKNVFEFAEHQKNYGLGYKMILARNKEESVWDKVASIADARMKIDHIYWYILHYTPSIPQQGILSKQTLSRDTHGASIY